MAGTSEGGMSQHGPTEAPSPAGTMWHFTKHSRMYLWRVHLWRAVWIEDEPKVYRIKFAGDQQDAWTMIPGRLRARQV